MAEEKKKRNYRNKGGKSKSILRRASVIKRLEAQLKSGVKPVKVDGRTRQETVELTETDVKRIRKEIETLNKRI